MKRNLSLSSWMLMLFCILATGCHKENEYSEEYMQAVLENAEQVMDAVADIYCTAETVEEMALHLNEIKAMVNVEDAWKEDDAIAVQIINGGIIKWCFPVPDTTDEMKGRDNIEGKEFKPIPLLCNNKKACISIAFPKDEGQFPSSSQESLDAVEKSLKNYGYSVRRVTGNDFTPAFFRFGIPNYGVNIIITHGGYDKYGHWIMTGKEFGKTDTSLSHYYDNWKNHKLQIWDTKELRNGRPVEKRYWAVSESYIDTNIKDNSFSQGSLMFVGACSTLKGGFGLWDILEKKGLGCYFGYDGKVSSKRSESNDLKKIMNYMLENGNLAYEAYSKVGSGTKPHLLLLPSKSTVILRGAPIFAVSDTKMVRFSPGNLAAGGRGFCANQWSYGGYFCWGSGSNPGNSSTDCCDYFPFDDWGNYIPGGWRTLSREEWAYIQSGLYGSRYRISATVNGVHGKVILPRWSSLPEGITLNPDHDWNSNVFNATQWVKMEDNGAIFLPAAGLRYVSNYSHQFVMDEIGECGHYWTSTYVPNDHVHVDPLDENSPPRLHDGPGEAYIYRICLEMCRYSDYKSELDFYFGCSVRLVQDINY